MKLPYTKKKSCLPEIQIIWTSCIFICLIWQPQFEEIIASRANHETENSQWGWLWILNLTYELQFREFLNKSEEKSLEKTRIHSEIFWLLNISNHYSIYPNRLENKTFTIVYIFAYRNTQCFLIFSTKIFPPSFLNFVLLMIKDRCKVLVWVSI